MTDHLTAPAADADEASASSDAGGPAAGRMAAGPSGPRQADAARAGTAQADTAQADAAQAGAAQADAAQAGAAQADTAQADAAQADGAQAQASQPGGHGAGGGGRRGWRGGAGPAAVAAGAGRGRDRAGRGARGGRGVPRLGPVGLGPGPLAVASVSAQGTIPAAGRTVLVIPVGEVARTPPVIDSVSIRGAGKYGAPGLFAVMGTASQDCAGIWAPAAGPGGFAQRCAPGGTVAVTGHLLPERGGAWGTDLALVVGPPGTSGCWAVSRVIIRYHVGHRHYTVTGGESLFGCTSQ